MTGGKRDRTSKRAKVLERSEGVARCHSVDRTARVMNTELGRKV